MSVYPHYSMTVDLLNWLAQQSLGYKETRLFHGLYHAVGLGLKDPKGWAFEARNPRTIPVALLRRTVGPAGARDNNHVKACLLGLQESVFKQIEITDQGRGLTFQFGNAVLRQSMGKNPVFGKFDVREVAQCRSLSDLLFLERDVVTRNQQWPGFRIPGINPSVPGKRWPDARDKWLRSACKISNLTGHRYLFAVAEDARMLGSPFVTVKMSHERTAWHAAKLYRFSHPVASLIEVDGGGYRYLGVEEVKAKEGFVRVPEITS